MIKRLQEFRRTPESAADWFAARRRGGQDRALERAFETWLAADPEHQRQYALCEIAWDLSGKAAERLSVTSPTPFPLRSASRWPWKLGLGLAASVLVAAAALWLTLGSDPKALHYATGPGEQRSIDLADGSRITMNTRTELRASITPDRREIMLESGEAYFAVAHDTARPFRVLTSLGQVSVVGTRFGVYRRTHSLEVATEDGLVRVTSASLPESTSAVLVRPGEEAVITAADAAPRLRPADLDRIDNWRHQRLEFDAVPLAELLEEFGRYTPMPLHVANDEIGAIPVSGVFHIGDVAALSHTLRAAFGLVVRDDGSGGLVVRRASDYMTTKR
ncbi:MAG: FecR domain-containing protein [Steroidobacteraceae bacterium]